MNLYFNYLPLLFKKHATNKKIMFYSNKKRYMNKKIIIHMINAFFSSLF